MIWIAGADGCKKGWFRISMEIRTAQLRFDCLENAEELLTRSPTPIILGLDMPIGLSSLKPRVCDKKARECLDPAKKSSVFPAPIRPILLEKEYTEACTISKKISDRKISKQTFYLLPKIRQVDSLLQKTKKYRDKIIEVHPEVSFWAWAKKKHLKYNKKTPEGRLERLKLINDYFGNASFKNARNCFQKQEVADDDILDAFATLWTAYRWQKKQAKNLPEIPEIDQTGLPMRIVF